MKNPTVTSPLGNNMTTEPCGLFTGINPNARRELDKYTNDARARVMSVVERKGGQAGATTNYWPPASTFDNRPA